jgi:threonine/homoserine/homoserine lactone efflux protein
MSHPPLFTRFLSFSFPLFLLLSLRRVSLAHVSSFAVDASRAVAHTLRGRERSEERVRLQYGVKLLFKAFLFSFVSPKRFFFWLAAVFLRFSRGSPTRLSLLFYENVPTRPVWQSVFFFVACTDLLLKTDN